MTFSIHAASLAFLGALTFAVGSVGAAGAISPDQTDPRVIAQAVESRPDGDRFSAVLRMAIVDATGKRRDRVMRWRWINFADGKKTLMLFESPAKIRNTGLLTIDYARGEKEDDQWLYLPALGRATRITPAGRSESFVGSDVSYADMTEIDTDAYDYELIAQSETVDGEDCWVIEATPRSERERVETGYARSRFWISKTKLIPLRIKAWHRKGRKVKLTRMGGVEAVDGVWIARKLQVRTMRGDRVQSTTVIALDDVRFGDPQVTDSLFTQRALERGL